MDKRAGNIPDGTLFTFSGCARVLKLPEGFLVCTNQPAYWKFWPDWTYTGSPEWEFPDYVEYPDAQLKIEMGLPA